MCVLLSVDMYVRTSYVRTFIDRLNTYICTLISYSIMCLMRHNYIRDWLKYYAYVRISHTHTHTHTHTSLFSPPPKGPSVSMEDFEKLYGSLLGWATSKTKWVKQRDFPPSLEEMRGRKAELQSYLTRELPVKTQEKAQLLEMEGMLMVCGCGCGWGRSFVHEHVVLVLMCECLSSCVWSFNPVWCVLNGG